MATEEDKNFGRLALELSLVNKPDMAKALMVVRKFEKEGNPKSLDRILLRMKLLSKFQVRSIYRTLRVKGCPYQIPDYEMLAKIGHGGMGSVYLARQISTGQEVAVKVLHPALAQDQEFVRLFTSEMRNAARLSHRNIVASLGCGSHEDVHYFVMEYVEGQTLAELLDESQQAVAEETARELAMQITSALIHIHEHGLVHCDIKPDNIMAAKDGVYKLADLGIAVAAGATAGITMRGTPSYMSPEVVLGYKDLDGRCDIYSLGATLYHLVTGRKPYEGKNTQEVSRMQIMIKPPAPHLRNPNVTERLSYVIEKMMDKTRSKRYQNAEELMIDLQRV